MKPKKLYRCPVCGDIVTEEKWLESIEHGGSGYCLCEFSAYDEKGELWFPRTYNEYDVYHLSAPTVKKEGT